MMRVLALLALSAAPVAAQEVTFTETEDGGIVHYQNQLTLWKPANVVETFSFSTDLGTVVMSLTRTPNDQCADPCPDILEITETPEGTVAIPR